MHSRFAIYGNSEEGILCKYMEIPAREVDDYAKPFVYAKMTLEIINHLDKQTSISKIIIPVQNLCLFYNEKFAATNKIRLAIKDTPLSHKIVAEVNSSSDPSQEGWERAKAGGDPKNDPFLMDEGLT